MLTPRCGFTRRPLHDNNNDDESNVKDDLTDLLTIYLLAVNVRLIVIQTMILHAHSPADK